MSATFGPRFNEVLESIGARLGEGHADLVADACFLMDLTPSVARGLVLTLHGKDARDALELYMNAVSRLAAAAGVKAPEVKTVFQAIKADEQEEGQP